MIGRNVSYDLLKLWPRYLYGEFSDSDRQVVCSVCKYWHDGFSVVRSTIVKHSPQKCYSYNVANEENYKRADCNASACTVFLDMDCHCTSNEFVLVWIPRLVFACITKFPWNVYQVHDHCMGHDDGRTILPRPLRQCASHIPMYFGTSVKFLERS
jgi:hypothetical protein